jgi:hypothetical protein
MRYRTYLVATAVLLAAGLVGLVRPAAAGILTKEIRSPLEGTIFDPCVGEDIAFSGFIQSFLAVTETPQGFTVHDHSSYSNVEGTGQASGTVYRVHCTEKNTEIHLPVETFEVVQGPITEPSVISSVLVLCRLSTNNAILTTRSHTTMTPDWDFAVDFTVEDLRCPP